jgi:hypothetical protein
MPERLLPLLLAVTLGLAGCSHGSSTSAADSAALAAARAGSRPIGGGPRFVPPAPGIAVRDCRRDRGARFGAHLELFAANRVVLIPAGVGTEPPRERTEGRITRAGCYGPVITVDPTGLLLVRSGSRATLGDLFREWGVPFARSRFLTFKGRVRAYVGGRPWHAAPNAIPLTRHAVIVIEVGPFVPPHTHYAFPPGA